MDDRTVLHTLIDQLPEDNILLVRELLSRIVRHGRIGDGEFIKAFESRPHDDEPATEEDLAAVEDALVDAPAELMKVSAIEAEFTHS